MSFFHQSPEKKKPQNGVSGNRFCGIPTSASVQS
jgi:hypothetical protein